MPILCESQDDALSIFQTINDRGMALDHAEDKQFKAQLYSIALKKNLLIDGNSLKKLAFFSLHAFLGAKGGD